MKLSLHRKMTNQELSQVFRFISGVLALDPKTNRFRVRAYDVAADTIEQYPQELHEAFLTSPDFDQIPGIGKTIEAKLVELFTTGNIDAFQKYVSDIPEGAWALEPVHGLGVKRAVQLATQFHLTESKTAISELLKHGENNEISSLAGWGEKSQTELIKNLQAHLERQKESTDRIPYSEAIKEAEELMGYLISERLVEKATPLGSLRRQSITVGDIDLGVQTTNMSKLAKNIKQHPLVKKVQVSGDQVVRLFLKSGHQVDIKRAEPAEWGAFIQHFTGSKEHNIKLREYSLKQGKSLSEHGIKIDGKLTPVADETEFYNLLGLNWIPPEERNGRNEIENAKR